MADCCLIKKVATVEVYENKNEVRAYGFMVGDRNTPVMEVRFKHLWGESNLSNCKLRWIIVDDVGSLLVGEVPIQSDNTALINLPNELFTGDRRMKVQLTVASCDGERILNLQQFTDLKVINSLAPNEVVEPVYQILINALHDESQKYLKELETSYTQKYGSLDSLYKSARASLEQYLVNAENGGNAEFLQGYAPGNFQKIEDNISDLIASSKYRVGDIVEVLGYYSKGDGTGHKRKIETSNDGSGVQISNSLWANVIINTNRMDVKFFGVKGGGLTDETTNLNKAINFARNKGLKIHFPKGNYKYNLAPDFDVSDFVGEGIIKTVDQWGYTHDFNVYYCENGVPYTVQNKLNQGIRKQTLTRIGIVGDSVTDGAWGDGWTENPTTNGNLSSTDYNHSYQGGQNSWFKRFFDLIAKVKDAFVPCNCSVSGKRLIDGWAYRNFDYGFFQNQAYGNTAPEICLLAMGINDNGQLQSFDAYRKEFDKFIRKAWGYGCAVGLVSISKQAKEWNYLEGSIKRTLKEFYKGVDYLDLSECLAELGSQGVYPNLDELWKMSTNDTTHPKQVGQMAMGEYAFKHFMGSVIIKQDLFVPAVSSKVFIQGYPSRKWYDIKLGVLGGLPYLEELKRYPVVEPINENITITYFLDNQKENNSLTLFVPFQPNTDNVNKPNLFVNITNNGIKYYSKNIGTIKENEYTTILIPNLRKGLNVIELVYNNEPNKCYLPTLRLDELNLQNFTSIKGLSINPNNIYVQPKNFTVPTIQNSFSLSGNNSQLPDKVITIDSNYPLSTTVEIKKINGNALIESDKVGILFYYKNGVGKSVLFYKNADSYEINIFDNRTKTKTLVSAFTKKPSEITGDFNLIFSYNQTTNNITCEMSTNDRVETIVVDGQNISGGKVAILNENSTNSKIYVDYALGLV